METRLLGALLLGTLGLAMNVAGSDDGTSETATSVTPCSRWGLCWQ
jgi:hypothetical protein